MSFSPFDDFKASPAELERFAALLASDPDANLQRRFEFFLDQDAEAATQKLGFVPLIEKNGFTCIHVPGAPPKSPGGRAGKDLVFSIGYWYSFGFPELMLLGGRGVGAEQLQPVLQQLGVELERVAADEPDDRPPPADRRAWLTERVQRFAPVAADVIRASGLPIHSLESPEPTFLEVHAYGYGWYFYRHFMDTVDVPLVLARVE